jgi:eukaryotic-like serine/threonine-protein kinase
MSAANQSARATAESRVGQVLNKWRIDRLIDMGGMAAVFAATHRNGKRVAIKMLHPKIAANAAIRDRFLREGYVANKIEHRGAVQILDDDITSDGAPFLVMELLDGESLEHWLTRSPGGRLPLPDVLAVADQVLDTLAVFHAQGVIHRDIKPGNLSVTREGIVKVLDFGLARLRDAGGTAPPTLAGTVLGTVEYMPPEQAAGKVDEVDARADIFAVGAVMFRAVAGTTFVRGNTPIERLRSSMKEPAPPLASVVPGLPSYVSDVVDTALAFQKERRWTDAGAMRVAVRAAHQALAAAAKKRPPLPGAGPTRDAGTLSRRDSPEDRSAAGPTGAETIYKEEALEPSILVEVSFGE